MSHIEEILKILQNLKGHLVDNDSSLIDQIVTLQQELNKIEKYDSSFSQISNLIKESILNLQEAGSQISSELMNLEFDPEELNSLEERINAIESLKRKYGGSIEAVLEKQSNKNQEDNYQCVSCKTLFPVISNIPRLTSLENYSESFGFQWNKFNLTQIDNYDTNNIFTLSYDRFFSQTNKSNSYFK